MFSIDIESYQHESLRVLGSIANRSSGNAVANFSIIVPGIPSVVEGVPGLNIGVRGSGRIDDMVRVTLDSWTFTADAQLGGIGATPPDGLLITFTVAPTAMSGFFEITGRVGTL